MMFSYFWVEKGVSNDVFFFILFFKLVLIFSILYAIIKMFMFYILTQTT